MENLIKAAQLHTLLDSGKPPILLHVLPEEHFNRQHLHGAKNACIYEVAFLDQVRELAPDLGAAIVVYGEGAPSLDSEIAAGRLRGAGYTEVSDLRGGLTEWIAAGFPIESQADTTPNKKAGGEFHVDVEKSVVRWTGRNLFNHHEGTVRLSSGSLVIEEGVLTQAEFVVNMRSILCSDLTDSTWNVMLLKHLSTDDFFATDAHPTAKFVAESAEVIADATEGTPNYKISGHFTLRGVTKPLSFPAVIAQEDQDHITGQAVLDLDRTQFGSVYGSGKFFAALGKHVVNDIIHLHLKVYATRAS